MGLPSLNMAIVCQRWHVLILSNLFTQCESNSIHAVVSMAMNSIKVFFISETFAGKCLLAVNFEFPISTDLFFPDILSPIPSPYAKFQKNLNVHCFHAQTAFSM
jgi:hypothetical protein